MRVRVLWFGRPGQSCFEDEVATYRRRVIRRWAGEDVPLKPYRKNRSDDPQRALHEEAELVRRQLPRDWPLIALDEAGERLSSTGLAQLMLSYEESAAPGLVFLVGSDLGLDGELKRGADRRLSLSPLTLPHLIARLVLWEQLFRATHILGGGSYHRGPS